MKRMTKLRKLKISTLAIIIMLVSSSLVYAGIGGEHVGAGLEEENLQILEE